MNMRDHVVALAVPLTVTLLLSAPLFDRMQGLSVDLLFLLRNTLAPEVIAEPAESVAVIGIDEETYSSEEAALENGKSFKDLARVFWTPAIAEVLNAVLDGGAVAFGFDLILPTSVEEFLNKAERTKFPKALGSARRENKVVLGATTLSNRSIEPNGLFQMAVRDRKAQESNIRSLNIALDSDGVIRFVPLHFKGRDADSGENALVPSMSLEMVHRLQSVKSRIDPDDGSLLLDDYRVPALEDPQLTIENGEAEVSLANELLVDLYGGPASFPTYSFVDLVLCAREGRLEYFRDHFAGKVVMLGLTTDVEDRKLTSVHLAQKPIAPGAIERCVPERYVAPPDGPNTKPRKLIPGVYLHAAAISNLAQQRVLRPFDRLERSGFTAILAVLVGFLALRLKSLYATSVFGLAAVGWTGVATGAFVSGFAVPLLHPIAAAGLTLAAMLGYRFTVSDRTERHIRRAFSRILAPALVERMVQTSQMPTQGGELREITVWISDLANYSTISEILPPDELVDFLNQVYSVMSDTVEDHGGFVAQFVGDAVVAAFNAPLDDPEHAKHGIEAALACCERVDALGKEMTLPEGFELRIRIGISTGPLLVGYIGSKRRLSYSIVGDDINLSSRLEGVNKVYGSTILVNEITKDLCGPSIAFREVDIVRVKGRDTPVRIFEPLGPADQVPADLAQARERFAVGLAHYRERRFEEAVEVFAALAEEDPVARVYLQRAKDYLAEPPTDDWDSIYTLLSK